MLAIISMIRWLLQTICRLSEEVQMHLSAQIWAGCLTDFFTGAMVLQAVPEATPDLLSASRRSTLPAPHCGAAGASLGTLCRVSKLQARSAGT
jgi:hypothetical protein